MATRLFHISDVHFGAENRAALAAIERAVEAERPDALVCTGDLTQRATHAQFAAAARWFGRFDIPVWLEPGNHDLPYFNLWERFADPYRRYNALHRAVAQARFETEDLVLVPLRTTVRAQARWPWSDGVVTRKALETTLTALAAHREDARAIIVTAHHPLHGPHENGPSATIGGNEAFALLADHGMDAIMTGHVHTPFNQDRRGGVRSARVIGAGTLSTRLRHGAPPSYNVVTCKRGPEGRGAISVEARLLDAGTAADPAG